MVLHDGVLDELFRGPGEKLLGPWKVVLFVVRPAQTVEIAAVVRIERHGLRQEPDGLVQAFATLGEHVPEVVERRGVGGIEREHRAKGFFGTGVLLALLEHGAQLELEHRVRRTSRNRLLEDLFGVREASRIRVDLRQRDGHRRIARRRRERVAVEPLEELEDRVGRRIVLAARALRDLCALLNKACDATPPIMSRPEELIATGWPERIRPLAEKTLLLMRRRGSFREEAEESEPGVKAAHGE